MNQPDRAHFSHRCSSDGDRHHVEEELRAYRSILFAQKESSDHSLRQTSTFPLLAASARGLNFQLSSALASDWWLRSSWTTSAWPKLAALCSGISPPSSFMWTLAFWLKRYSTTSLRPNPEWEKAAWIDTSTDKDHFVLLDEERIIACVYRNWSEEVSIFCRVNLEHWYSRAWPVVWSYSDLRFGKLQTVLSVSHPWIMNFISYTWSLVVTTQIGKEKVLKQNVRPCR